MIFMHLRSKLTSETCQKIGGLGGKTEQNGKSAQFAQLSLFITRICSHVLKKLLVAYSWIEGSFERNIVQFCILFFAFLYEINLKAMNI